MKFQITLKDPDGIYDAVKAAVESNKPANLGELENTWIDLKMDGLFTTLNRWFEYGEYVTIEIDTDLMTATVLKN